MHALLYGNRRLAIQLVQTEALTQKNVKDIYLHVLQPVQREISRLWQMRQLSVAMEHYCSETTQLMMSQALSVSLDRAAAWARAGGDLC